MNSHPKEKTRRGGAGSLWGQVAREIARIVYQGAPLFALGFCWGLAIGLEARL
jgi:hypothetical protein